MSQLVDAFFALHPEKAIRAAHGMLSFPEGFESYNREALIVTTDFGSAEASPLPGYFNDIDACIGAAIDTVSKPWPEAVRNHVDINTLLTPSMNIENLNTEVHTLKIKITQPADYEKVLTARSILGSDVRLRVDCNGAFDVDTAIMFARLIHPANIEFIEQPCATNDECARVNIATDIPIALDETARNEDDLREIEQLGSGDIIVLKVQPLGGLHSALEFAEKWGRDVVVSSMMESRVGYAVSMALACAVPELNYACGLETVANDTIFEPIDNQT